MGSILLTVAVDAKRGMILWIPEILTCAGSLQRATPTAVLNHTGFLGQRCLVTKYFALWEPHNEPPSPEIGQAKLLLSARSSTWPFQTPRDFGKLAKMARIDPFRYQRFGSMPGPK